MSALVHCDGPGCDKTRHTDFEDQRIGVAPWIHVEQDRVRPHLDFHSKECLANWSFGIDPDRCREGFHTIGDGGVRKAVVCNQVKGHDGPHALVTSRRVHAQVDGR